MIWFERDLNELFFGCVLRCCKRQGRKKRPVWLQNTLRKRVKFAHKNNIYSQYFSPNSYSGFIVLAEQTVDKLMLGTPKLISLLSSRMEGETFLILLTFPCTSAHQENFLKSKFTRFRKVFCRQTGRCFLPCLFTTPVGHTHKNNSFKSRLSFPGWENWQYCIECLRAFIR